MEINKLELLVSILDMINKQNDKMDKAGTISADVKLRNDGYIEALYHFENLILNWGIENEVAR